MPRWTPQEVSEIEIVRERLSELLAEAPKFPEVVGDRKIIRYLRGHDHNIEKVCGLYGKFLKWRKDSKIDEIRQNIVEGGMDHPLKFPKGELIQSLMPALIIDPIAQDSFGCPLVVDQYNFSPQDLLANFTIDDYIVYATYCLEYRQIILEQMSEERESAFLQSLSLSEREEVEKIDSSKPPYGVIAQSCVIRDLNGVGFEHLSTKGQEIIRAVIALASDNYPELMRKAFMINTPWIFNTVWYFIKGLLAARTVEKISIIGTSFMEEIEREIPRDYIPALVGGRYIGYQQYIQYPFNKSYLCAASQNIEQEVQPIAEDSQNIVANNEDSTAIVNPTAVVQPVIAPTTVKESNAEAQQATAADDIDVSLISLQTSG